MPSQQPQQPAPAAPVALTTPTKRNLKTHNTLVDGDCEALAGSSNSSAQVAGIVVPAVASVAPCPGTAPPASATAPAAATSIVPTQPTSIAPVPSQQQPPVSAAVPPAVAEHPERNNKTQTQKGSGNSKERAEKSSSESADLAKPKGSAVSKLVQLFDPGKTSDRELLANVLKGLAASKPGTGNTIRSAAAVAAKQQAANVKSPPVCGSVSSKTSLPAGATHSNAQKPANFRPLRV
jgi:hypothetical protein